MDEQVGSGPSDEHAETVRLQAEEHPLIEDTPPATAAEHCLRLMHLRAYDEAVGHAAGRDVLDVGCNTGYGTMRFAPVARRVVGVDVSVRAIEAALERAVGGRPEFVLTSGFALPFPDAAFDLVTSFQVLEHVPDPTAFLRELARVARPGGQVILATPNAATRLDPGMTPWNRFHVHEYVAGELEHLLLDVFSAVSVLGMFGRPELYETEIARVDAARQRVRRIEAAAARLAEREAARTAPTSPAKARRPIRGPRAWPIRLARAVVPAPVRAWLRSRLRSTAAVSSMPGPVQRVGMAAPAAPVAPPPAGELEAFLRFTVDDLWYASSELDQAMDLLAICGVAPPPATDA